MTPFWNPKRRVWYEKNDDSTLGRDRSCKGRRKLTKLDAEVFANRINRYLRLREHRETRELERRHDKEHAVKKFNLIPEDKDD